MTAILAVSDAYNSWIGADHAVTYGDIQFPNGSKIVDLGNVVVACAGDARIYLALDSILEDYPEGYEFSGPGYRVVRQLRTLIEDTGCLTEGMDWGLLGVRKDAPGFVVLGSEAACAPHEGVLCEGNGGAVALGAYKAMREAGAEAAIECALRIACENVIGVGLPVEVRRVR